MRKEVVHRREQWKKYQKNIAPEKLVFLDETWIKTNMIRTRGWSKKGERLLDYTPFGHWKTLTFIGALRQSGMIAPMVFDSPICGDSFKAWVEQCLLPELKEGDVVIMDNLSSHKTQSIRKLIRSVGAKVFYLPPYSPDLNPIENCFSKVKSWLRKERQTQIDELIKTTGKIIDMITSQEASNYFFNAGYSI